MHVHIHTHTMERLAMIKNELFPLATTWMDLEGIMLREIRQRKIMYGFIYMELKTTNEQQQQKAGIIDTENKRGCQRERGKK